MKLNTVTHGVDLRAGTDALSLAVSEGESHDSLAVQIAGNLHAKSEGEHNTARIRSHTHLHCTSRRAYEKYPLTRIPCATNIVDLFSYG